MLKHRGNTIEKRATDRRVRTCIFLCFLYVSSGSAYPTTPLAARTPLFSLGHCLKGTRVDMLYNISSCYSPSIIIRVSSFSNTYVIIAFDYTVVTYFHEAITPTDDTSAKRRRHIRRAEGFSLSP